MTVREFVRMFGRVQMLPVLESGEETLIGGQAVMEGVMMRAPHAYCIAVRKPDGTIVTESKPISKVSEKYPIFKYPVLRGLGTLGQAMVLGYKSLQYSANVAVDAAPALLNMIAPGCMGTAGEGKKPAFSNAVMTVQLLLSLAFFIFAYKLVPLWITTKLSAAFPALGGRIAFNFVDGMIRIAIFLMFMWLMSQWKDIRRVFEYHGAEHRVVFNYESGKPVTVPTAQSFTTFHPRCGTSFLITVMLISMAVYTVLPFDSFAGRMASRIVCLPLIAGLSYELIRFAAKRRGSLLALLTMPGLWLQRITTKPPTDDQTEIAITALEGAMSLEKSNGGELVIA
ncbi:MAG: DUF1385 domain-containing protein [Bryobacteraceae bacterium]